MKYSKKNKLKYEGLSRDEVYLISRAEFENQKPVTQEFTLKLFKNNKKTNNILDNLKRKGRLLQIEKGKYFIVPIRAPNQLWMPNEFIAAKYWIGDVPYYIGYFTMYNYWGFTDQVPQTIYVLNTKKSRSKVIGNTNYKAVKIIKDKYYGIKKVKIENEDIIISDKERTLVDLIYNPPGSFEQMKGVLKDNIQKIDIEKFISYLIKFPSKAVIKRAGYLMERYDCKKKLIQKIKSNLGNKNTYVVLNPENQTRKGKLNKDWKLIINE